MQGIPVPRPPPNRHDSLSLSLSLSLSPSLNRRRGATTHGYVIGSSFNRKRNILFCSRRASMPQACIHGAEKYFCECFRFFQHEMSTMHCSASVAPKRSAASCAHCYAEWISKVESKPDLGMVGIHSELFAPMPAPYAPWLRLRLTREEFIRAVGRDYHTHPGGCTWWYPHYTPVDAAQWWGLFWRAASSTSDSGDLSAWGCVGGG